MKRVLRFIIPVILICGLAAGYFGWHKIKAKELYNEGAQAFNKGHYQQAEICFHRSIGLNPENINARLFYAASLRAQFVSNQSTMENITIAKRALAAYFDLLRMGKGLKELDTACAAIADLYGELGEREESRNWLERRINLPGQSDEVRFKSHYGLAVSYWQEADRILRQYQQPGQKDEYRPLAEWQIGDAERAKELLQKGLNDLAFSLKIDPKCADCYNYRAMLTRDLAQVETDARIKAQLNPDADMAEFHRLKRESAEPR